MGFKDRIKASREQFDKRLPKCPYCGSNNNNLGDPLKKAWGNSVGASKKLGMGLTFWPAAPFVGNKDKAKAKAPANGECFDCGRKWRL